MNALRDLTGIFTQWRCWYLMSAQDIGMRYKRSVLGPFWISASILAFTLGLSLVYAQVYHLPYREYVSYLACGVLAWTFLSGVILEGANSVMENASNLRGVPISLSVLGARVVARATIIFLHNLPPIVIVLLLFGHQQDWRILMLIPALMLYIVLGLFISVTLGPLCARFRDIPEVIKNAVQLTFFITPIMWQPARLGKNIIIAEANPFYHLIQLVRGPLLQEPFEIRHWIVSAMVVVFFMGAALIMLNASKKRVVLWL